MWKLLVLAVLGGTAIAGAGVPPVSHLGAVYDAKSSEPVVGVKVVGFADEWPDSVPIHAISTSYSDSMGVYSIGMNRPGYVYFVKVGYDSLMLHWPEEFEGSDQSGCGVNLGPIFLTPATR